MSQFWRHFISNGRARLVEDHLGLFGHGTADGFKVRLVHMGSPAAEAGLQNGDVLLALAQTPITTLAGLERLLLDLPVGMPLPVVFRRDGRQLERWLILAEHPQASDVRR